MFTVSFRKKLNPRLSPYKTQLLSDYRCKTAVKEKSLRLSSCYLFRPGKLLHGSLPSSSRRLHGAILLKKENSLRSVSNLDSLTLK
jgi:hypothetical protein